MSVSAVAMYTQRNNSALAAGLLDTKDWMSEPVTDPVELTKVHIAVTI